MQNDTNCGMNSDIYNEVNNDNSYNVNINSIINCINITNDNNRNINNSNNINNNSNNKNKININNNSNNKKEKDLSEKEANDEGKMHFICKRCNTVPFLKFISFNLVYYRCNCHESSKLTVDEILNINIYDERMNNYIKTENKDISQNNKRDKKDDFTCKKSSYINNEEKEKHREPHFLSLKCLEHEEIFVYYCFKCNQNICRRCLRETPDHVEHYNEPIELFDIKFNKIDTILKNIEDTLKVKNNDSNKIKKFKKLMNIIIEDYRNFPNHSHFLIIESCNQLLQKSGSEKNSNKDSINENFVYIKNQKELEDNLENPHKIKKIIINTCNKNIISSMGFLNSELINLIELNLSDNSINSIEVLANNKMENLEILNLSCNEIDDSNIKYFFQLDFPKLKDLNLFLNKLTDPELLKFKNDENNLPKLEIFFIGKNKFKFNEKNKNDRYDFFSVKEIGISRKFFNQDSIKYIQCFTLTNLEIIYLSNNNLEKFDFINGLELPSIKEFWLNDNNFAVFEPLEKYENLEVIEMKNNNIKDIDNIGEFINRMKKLTRFNLEGNKFEYNLLNNLLIDSQVNNCKIIINPY